MRTVLSFLHQKKMIEHQEVEEDMHCEGDNAAQEICTHTN